MISSFIRKIIASQKKTFTQTKILRFESLEERRLLTTYSVTSGVDSTSTPYTSGSLRWAIYNANTHAGADTIVISENVAQVNLVAELPEITEGVTIRWADTSGSKLVISAAGYYGDGYGFYVECVNENSPQSFTFENINFAYVNGSTFYFNGDGIASVTIRNCCANVAHSTTGFANGARGYGIEINTENTIFTVEDFLAYQRQVGIWFDGENVDLNISESLFSSWGYDNPNEDTIGVNCIGTGTVTIEDNIFKNIAGYGIYIDGDNSDDLQVEISNNNIGIDDQGVDYAIGCDGIYAANWLGDEQGSSSIYNDNDIENCEGSGIELWNCRNIIVSSNTISNNSEYAVSIFSGGYTSNNIIIYNNTIEDNADCGIYLYGIYVSAIYISSNTIISGDNAAVKIDRAYVYGVYIAGNDYTTSASPIELKSGSNHGLASPDMEDLGIYRQIDDVAQQDTWYMPYTLNAEDFAGMDFIIQIYLRTGSGEYEYTYVDYISATADESGIIDGVLQLTCAADQLNGAYVAIVATCVADGTYESDTSEFSNVVQLVDTAPRVVKVTVGNSTASDEIETAADASTQLVPVKLDGGVDRVTITFDRPIDDDDLTAVEGALSIDGRVVAWADWSDDLADRSVSFSADRKTITWTFADGLHLRGEMIITLSAAAIKTNGIALDGEWNSPTYWGDTVGNSTFAAGGCSGNGTAGGDFTFNFTLPNTRIGDANRDGIVNNLDAAILSMHWLQAGTWADGDFNGNGIVNDIDATLLAINWLQTVWAAA